MAQAIHAMVSDHETILVTRSENHEMFMMNILVNEKSTTVVLPESAWGDADAEAALHFLLRL